jgi:hypothetical protein
VPAQPELEALTTRRRASTCPIGPDANAHAIWTAQSGNYYYTREGGKQVRHVQWSAASGELDHVFDDELVQASKGVNPGLLRGVEPFPTSTLIPYDPGYLAGWSVERYQIDLVSAATRSREQMEATLQQLCAAQVGIFAIWWSAPFSDQEVQHILVPVWLLSVMYGKRSYQVGQRRDRRDRRRSPVELVKIIMLA